MDFNSSNFKKLKAKWYKKLEKSGFVDAEDNRGYNNVKDAHQAHFYKLADKPLKYESTRDYYYFADQFLHSYAFENKRDYNIWEDHAAGLSYREISKKRRISLSVVFKSVNITKVAFFRAYNFRPRSPNA